MSVSVALEVWARYNVPMKVLKILGVLFAGFLVLAGGGFYWLSSNLEPDVAIGSASPDVSVTTMDGEQLALSSLRGKVVLLEFWGST